ncbi:MAG: type II toxin-antitoxin system RelB/DinJ family antitoxin [Fusobacteriaceae bacterium]|jgi:DNA-damage-inducible protein J|nr:type II toxin-antitoxin system RelB/DinJ family antitoxin [Fusobacteriaceae bacterium]
MSTNINIRTDKELKSQAQALFADLGLDISTAVNIFLRQAVYKQGIPFEISKSADNLKNKKLPFSTLKGVLAGKVTMADDFDAPMEEFTEYM